MPGLCFIPSVSRVPGLGSVQWGVLGDYPDDGEDEAEGVRYCFCFFEDLALHLGLLRWHSGKEYACKAGDLGSIPGLGRSSGDWNGNPLQCSCLENPMGRGTWQSTVHGVAKSQT